MWSPTKEEVKHVLALSDAERYKYLLNRVADCAEVWSLWQNEGWCLYGDTNGKELVPLWPHPEYVTRCALAEFDSAEPRKIELGFFLERWIPGMLKDKREIAAFPTPASRGVVVTPEVFARDLEAALEQY